MEKLNRRLYASGVTDHFFVNDEDGTDQIIPSKLDAQVLERSDKGKLKDVSAVHVKTLVWKGVYIESSSSSRKDEEFESEAKEDKNKTFYFVTALRVQDKVELKFLRNIVKEEFPRQKGTLLVQMAEREVAENLTGFVSGSMPPGWHRVPLKLFVDDYIIEEANITKPFSEMKTDSNEGNEDFVMSRMMKDFPNPTDQLSDTMLSVGAGSNDYSLHISLRALLECSHTTEQENGEIKLRSDGEIKRRICSFTKTRANEKYRNHQRMQSLKANAQRSKNRCDSRQKDSIMDWTVDGGTITRRSLQIASRKKGTIAKVREMIKHIGNEFPSYMSVVDTEKKGSKFTSEVNKNALHYASWKGDLETINLLVNTGIQFQETKGLVNFISTGEGNYGKTPIFYSITQSRDGKSHISRNKFDSL